MGLYNFKKQFADKVERGEKLHTIRAKRAQRARVGETLHLYTGLRQKGARKLLEAMCTRVEDIRFVVCEYGCEVAVQIDGRCLSDLEREELARSDGFTDWKDMLSFWADRLGPATPEWIGDVIHWRYPEVRS